MTMKASLFVIFAIFLVRANCGILEELTISFSNIPEDGRLQFCELAIKYNYNCVRYNVTTADGYELGLFNIPGDRRKPVFIQHGFVASSIIFLVRTTLSLVVDLAKKGYDIWLGNMRGNSYSRAHVSLSPDGLEFWNFSFHESGVYDLPAMIDFVLEKTDQKALHVIGHSLGTTVVFVMCSMRPEYNKKIKSLICLAPIAYLHNAVKPVFPLLSSDIIGPALSQAITIIAHGEFAGNSSEFVKLTRAVCSQGLIGYTLCTEGFANPIFGRDPSQLEPEFFRVAIGHYPAGSSTKSLVHLAQIVTRKLFAQYDYGLIQNLIKYKRTRPPIYNLRKITVNIAIVVGLGDTLADIEDIRLLRKQLPNVVDYYVMKRKEWNHMDFVWANNATELFEYIHRILSP